MNEKKNEATVPQAKPATKMDAVRKALAALGKDAMPLQIQEYLKDVFGLDMITNHISSYKTDILKKRTVKRKIGAKPVVAKPAESKKIEAPKKAAAPQAKHGAASSISLEDIETAKKLVGHVGSHNLKALIDLLSK